MYKLLALHMNPSPQYMFGHAIIAGYLADNHERVSTYEKYKAECDNQGVVYYSEDVYRQFMIDTKRISVPKTGS